MKKIFMIVIINLLLFVVLGCKINNKEEKLDSIDEVVKLFTIDEVAKIEIQTNEAITSKEEYVDAKVSKQHI